MKQQAFSAKIPFIICSICLWALLWACKSSDNKAENNDLTLTVPVDGDTGQNNEPFYPFTEYLENQLKYIDTTPIALEQTITTDAGKSKPVFIEKTAFRKFMAPFLAINPELKALKPGYREKSFIDNTIKKLTFTIEAVNDSLPLRQADIHLNPENEKVTNLVLHFVRQYPDSTVVQYLVWQHNMNCQLSEQIQTKAGNTYRRVTNVVWDRPLQ
ncbi:MAG: hypothetical protein MUF24_12560 [Chitinophagaceae bacterium]|jgi:hypothetical protein|nr:hypothetical protein [Chitinophagaceae bacterium]